METTLDTASIAAEALDAIDRRKRLQPFTERIEGLDLAAAYRVTAQIYERRIARGEKRMGRKIGFTNRTIWERYGVHEPMWGTVYDKTMVSSDGGRASVALAGLAQPRIEPEIAFRLKSAPPATQDPQALLACIEWIAHAVEIVQCHHPQWKVTIADCTADNGLHGRLVLGTPVPVEKIAGLAAALPFLKVTLRKGNEVKDQGIGSNVLGSPLLALAFLAEVLEKQGEKLEPGEIISTGTLTDAHPVEAGETWSTSFQDFPISGLTIDFAE